MTKPPKPQPTGLSRRSMLGAGATAAVAFPVLPALAAVKTPAAVIDGWTPKFFTAQQGAVVAALSDVILPKTSTPSATEALVHEYIDEALSVAEADEQLEFLGGLAWLEDHAIDRFGARLEALVPDQQSALLMEISDHHDHAGRLKTGAAFFVDLKQRVLFGYYTSKIGRTEALGKPAAVKRERLVGCTHGSGHHP